MYLLSDQRFGRITAISALDPDALPIPLVPPTTIGGLGHPGACCLDAQSRVHVVDTDNARIASYDFGTNTWTAFGSGALTAPTGVGADAVGSIYIADAPRVLRVDDVSGAGMVQLAGIDPSRRPVAVTCIGSRIAIVDGQTRGIATSDDAGATWVDHPLPPGPMLNHPVAITPRPDGGVLVTDLGNRRVVAFDAAGSATMVLSDTDGLVAPVAAVDDGPGITVADAGPGWIRRYLPVNGAWVAADFLRGRNPDGSYRFDKVAGLAIGAVA
jgi:hypothetical protein